MSTELSRLSELARADKTTRFLSIAHHLTPTALMAAFEGLRKDASAGVDGVTYREYEQDVWGNIPALHHRLVSHQYRAQPTGAVYDSRPDHPQTLSAECEGGGAVVPATSARPGRDAGRGAQCQTPGPLPVLRTADELPQSLAVLSARPPALAQVADPTYAGEAADLGYLPTAAQPPSAACPAHLPCLGQHGESCMRNPVR